MNKYLFLILFFFPVSLLAHSPKETHTQMRLEEGQLLVTIELPWSIRNALKAEYGKISENSSKEEVMKLLRKYVLENFQLEFEGKDLEPNSFMEVDPDHTHSLRLSLSYEVTDLVGLTVKNSLLFNLYEEQKNHVMVVYSDDFTMSYLTSNANGLKSSFQIHESDAGAAFHQRTNCGPLFSIPGYFRGVLWLIPVLILLGFLFRRRYSKSR